MKYRHGHGQILAPIFKPFWFKCCFDFQIFEYLTVYHTTFLKSAIQGLPDGQDGQVGAGHGSRVVPEGPDQLLVKSGNKLWTNINEFQQKVKRQEKEAAK